MAAGDGRRRVTAVRALYSLLLALLQPVYRIRLWWRGRREPLYRHAVGERFGHYAEPPSSGWIWLHAVSLGETRAAAALVAALRALRPESRLLLTHGTATGREAGRELLREGDRQVWLPFDTPWATARFLAQFSPAVGVLMETEIWPNLIAAVRAAGVPLVLANARMSEKSARRGDRLDLLRRPALGALTQALAQTEADATRLRAAGAVAVQVVGNLKFDVAPDAGLQAVGQRWRAATGRPVVLAASTREGEEPMLLAAWARLPQPRPLLVVVPRHPQRFDAVAALVAAHGLAPLRRSGWAASPPADAARADVWLGDSMGEMPLYYALADVALLGGSFAPLGGQNLIEAAACACPVVMGPHTFNFAQAAELALAAGAALRVADVDEAIAVALELIAAPERRSAAAAAARHFAGAHRGAARRMAEAIVATLAQPTTVVKSPP
jgi:3-deoxy-D-manno-octulosonic-acid transferase